MLCTIVNININTNISKSGYFLFIIPPLPEKLFKLLSVVLEPISVQ